MHSEAIIHQGTVKRVFGDNVEVEIQTGSACAHCSATDQCVSSDSKTRNITVTNYRGSVLSEGDEVTIKSDNNNGLTAVLFAYFVPFILVVLTLFIVNYFIKNEAIAGGAALGILVPYYFVIWIYKNKLRKKFTFKILT